MSDERKQRLAELVSQRRYEAAVDAVGADLRTLGVPASAQNAVSKEAVVAAQAELRSFLGFHFVSHRTWGVRLRAEVLATANRLAATFLDETAVLVWGQQPQAGFLIPVDIALGALAANVGPEGDGTTWPELVSDLLVVADDGQTGLLLEYNHLSHADQYELHTWGRFAICLE